MKPVRIFLFFLFLFLFFLGLSLLVPDRTISLGTLGRLRFPGFGDLIVKPRDPYTDITPLLQMVRQKDTLVTGKTVTAGKTLNLLKEAVVQPVEYPGGDPAALSGFFESLRKLSENGNGIHVLHFGDSQLEGDRITDYLRARFQTEFGGSGPGLIPLNPEQSRSGVSISATGDWHHYSGLGVVDKSIPRGRFGPLGALYRFTTFAYDTSSSEENQSAAIAFHLTGKSAGGSNLFSQVRLFYTHSRHTCRIELQQDGQTIARDSAEPANTTAVLRYRFPAPQSAVGFRFEGTGSPDFLGLSLDNPNGISFDNIPLRGSSGLEFTRMNREALQFILNELNARLLILEFGVNVLPNPAEDYTYYQNGFYRQLMFLKELRPEMSILVIGISDASVKNGTDYQSYPNVEKIVAAQRNAALKAGCAFWDLYQAMGGKNSMPGWVFANPPLATTDFIHFNYAGARIVGKMFYDALISDYSTYQNSR